MQNQHFFGSVILIEKRSSEDLRKNLFNNLFKKSIPSTGLQFKIQNWTSSFKLHLSDDSLQFLSQTKINNFFKNKF